MRVVCGFDIGAKRRRESRLECWLRTAVGAKPRHAKEALYREPAKGLQILLSRTQAGPGRAVKQEQEEISPNHVQAMYSHRVAIGKAWSLCRRATLLVMT